jgi:HSP20 family protein
MMALIRHSNFPTIGGSLFPEFFDDDRFLNFPLLRGQNVPAVNVKETEKAYEVELASPGFNKKDFKISIDDGLLTVSAEKEQEKEEKKDNYTRREFGYASFSRSFNLPVNTNEEDVQAKYEEGILKLVIAKKGTPESKPKKPIEIK